MSAKKSPVAWLVVIGFTGVLCAAAYVSYQERHSPEAVAERAKMAQERIVEAERRREEAAARRKAESERRARMRREAEERARRWTTNGHIAQSKQVTSQPAMEFPYQATKSSMRVECRGGKPSVHFEFSQAPNLTNSTPKSGGYNEILTGTILDGRVQTLELTQNWGSKIIRLNRSDEFLPLVQGSSTFSLWLKWYGTEGVLFDYDMTGAKDAIANLPC